MRSELSRVLAGCRSAFVGVGLLSGLSNILALTGSVFMLAVYDRVIPSGSIPTLLGLGLLALVIYALQAIVDIFRGRILTRTGLVIKEAFASRAYDTIVRNSAQGDLRSGNIVRDLDQVQGFLSSMAPTAIFDLPWLPLYLGICFAFHFYIGVAVTVGAVVLIIITAISNSLTKGPSSELNDRMNKRGSFLAASQNNAETIQTMGMNLAMSGTWNRIENEIIGESRRIADITTMLGTTSRVFRMVLQSFVLAVGAYLVIMQDATGGIMIASSILSARAMAPIELTIGHWKNSVAFRQSWKRLGELFEKNPPEASRFVLPAPSRILSVEGVSVSLPNIKRLVVRDVSFQLKAGEALGIIGATGSGKSSLVRAIVGLWPAALGTVRLDGQVISRWSTTDRGRFMGYVPQNVALFQGTIAENIARFDPDSDSASVVAVARQAGVHDMISRLPEGYDTQISDGGAGLSGGQAQRIALARALYGDPFLVVMDEPNSNLDADGELALQEAIAAVRARGGIVLIVAHRPTILSSVNHILVMSEGRVQKFGTREEVLELMTRRPQAVTNNQAPASPPASNTAA